MNAKADSVNATPKQENKGTVNPQKICIHRTLVKLSFFGEVLDVGCGCRV